MTTFPPLKPSYTPLHHSSQLLFPSYHLDAPSSEAQHHLSLLFSLTLTFLTHSSLFWTVAYWVLSLVRFALAPLIPCSRLPAVPVPAALSPPPNGLVSPYWATLHGLRAEMRRNINAARVAAGSYVLGLVVLARMPRETGEELYELLFGQVLPWLVLVLFNVLMLGVVVRLWALKGLLKGLASEVWEAVDKAAREVGRSWGYFLLRHWMRILAGFAVFVFVLLV
ncbi:hypothetical protein VTI74DRAFT_3552 [Chaetomium olivicolor]